MDRVIDGNEWAMQDLRKTLRRIRIHQEYFNKLKNRPRESELIKEELSLKYFNTPTRTKTIEYIIYDLPRR